MQIETSNETDIQCKDLIGEAYFSRIDALWEKIQKILKVDLCTTTDEDHQAYDILSEVFEEACNTAKGEGFLTDAPDYVDYKQLWERLCDILGVKV